MLHFTTSLLFSIALLGSMAMISAMIGQNRAAILSALRGRGAFPISPSPEKGPPAEIRFPTRQKARPVRPMEMKTAQPNWGHAV